MMSKRLLLPLAFCLATLTGLCLAADTPAGTTPPKRVLKWVGCGISKLGFMQDLARAYEKRTGVKIVIEGGGATKGLREVSAKQSNMGGSCRLPLVLRGKNGVAKVDPAERNIKIIPMGWDALVVIVHKDNKEVSNLTVAQLRDVLTGKITTWKELGGTSDHPINLYIRKGRISGVGATLRQQLFNNPRQEFAARAKVLASSGKIEKAVEADPYGLAVSGISSSRHRKVHMLSLDGAAPTMDNMKGAKYHLYRILFLVVPPDYTSDPDIKAFVDFALSLDGEAVIEKAGTLPYHKGIWLLRAGASSEYIMNMEVIDDKGMYTLGGH